MKNKIQILIINACRIIASLFSIAIQILIINACRIIASLFSIATGTASVYYFFNVLYQNDKIVLVSSFIIVFFWELLLIFTLNKFFKKVLKKEKILFVFLFFTLIFYSGSFFLSINGMSEFIENKKNETVNIENNTMAITDSIINLYETKKQKRQLDSIINLGYTTKLIMAQTTYLQNQIINYENKKDSLIKLQNKTSKIDIDKNISEIKKIKNEYYIITFVLIFLIFVLNLYFNILTMQKKDFFISEKDFLELRNNNEIMQGEILKFMKLKKDFKSVLENEKRLLKLNNSLVLENQKNSVNQLDINKLKSFETLLDNKQIFIDYLNQRINQLRKNTEKKEPFEKLKTLFNQ